MLSNGKPGATPMHVDESTMWVPQSEQDREMVRRQMRRLLETTHFRNSRRYPALFRFIVEETLEGRGEFLKERLIGVQVFGRPADYDTATDPIVRVTIAEIRKRIAQYYHDEAHDHEMRIELLPGSYEPEFRPGRDGRLEHLPDNGIVQAHDFSAAADHAHPDSIAAHVAATSATREAAPRHRAWLWWLAAAGCCALLACGWSAWQAMHPSAIDQLWNPILSAHKPVMLVLPVAGGKYGDVQSSVPLEAAKPVNASAADPDASFLQRESAGENVVFSDVTAIIRIANLIALCHGESRVRLNTAITLDDLHQGPTVLIGGLDNQWTLRALKQLRYQFAGSDEQGFWIADTKSGHPTPWSLDLKKPVDLVNHDYALVARVHDEATGQPEIVVAGIGMSGTAAAGELLVDRQQVEELRRRIGPAFKDHDFEAVLSTDVVNGIAGSPRILTVSVP
jgi:hypothetical protein